MTERIRTRLRMGDRGLGFVGQKEEVRVRILKLSTACNN